MDKSHSVIIIGAGIAGLSTGIYAQLNGYPSQIFELHNVPGGLMTAWKRKGYTIDGCIHWLTGSAPSSGWYALWEEIGLIQNREIFDPDVFYRYESRDGKILTMYTDLDRLETHMIELAPEDSAYIHSFVQAARAMTRYNPSMPPSDNWLAKSWNTLRSLPMMVTVMPALMKWGKMTMAEFSNGFKNAFLREVFENMWMPEMSAAGLVFTLAFLHNHAAGYPIGGSLPMALAVEKRYRDLGGKITYDARVEKILVENDRAVGVRLEDGSEHRADYVVSAADGHATIFDMLEGCYVDEKIRKVYAEYKVFPPILLVGLGVNRTFPDLPCATAGIQMALKDPIQVAGQPVHKLEIMAYNFDPTLAPAGKTILTAMIETDYSYWKTLIEDRERYDAEKQQVAIQMINRLDQRFPGLAGQVEMADVATPVTFERYTANWQASFEGFLPTPKSVTTSIPKTLPGLDHFYMAGQWVQAGGGLPSGVMTGRDVIMKICKQDGIRFTTRK